MEQHSYQASSPEDAIQHFEPQGFYLVPKLFEHHEIEVIKPTLELFHQNWQADNLEFYQSRAINSAYLTGKKYLPDSKRTSLFEFISHFKLMPYVLTHFDKPPAFMGTQLFFNPYNPEQKNYWHRDTQYHLDLEQQKQIMQRSDLLHFRIALADEPGIELIPTTHQRWDTELETNVRLELHGHKHHEALPNAKTIPMSKGDLLVFSGNMLHRGLYGKNRLALDVLYCENQNEFLKFVQPDTLPSQEQLTLLEHPAPFQNSLAHLKSVSKHAKH